MVTNKFPIASGKAFRLVILLLVLLICVSILHRDVFATSILKDLNNEINNTIYYVSKMGNNSDGKSWDTAWNELDQIRWEVVLPGDTILLDGGEYHKGMRIKSSGAPGNPITITTNGEKVVLDGQRPPPPYCGQTDYNPVPGNEGIKMDGESHIIIDGRDWSGIVIRHHTKGIRMRYTSDIIVRNVEIYNNGYDRGSGDDLWPDGKGVGFSGENILFEKVIIHDNGQDAFQSGWGVWNFTLRNSWLYNSREHPYESGSSFNYCSHTDGIQIFDGGVQGPITIEDSIIGPSFTQGIIIGAPATVNDVVIKNTLFVGSTNSGIVISAGGVSSGWRLKNITVVQPPSGRAWNIYMNGNDHKITDSIFWGGPWGIGVFNWAEVTQNFSWLTPDNYNVADELDPMFDDSDYMDVSGTGFAEFNFTILNPAMSKDIGSSITSVDELLDGTISSNILYFPLVNQ